MVLPTDTTTQIHDRAYSLLNYTVHLDFSVKCNLIRYHYHNFEIFQAFYKNNSSAIPVQTLLVRIEALFLAQSAVRIASEQYCTPLPK